MDTITSELTLMCRFLNTITYLWIRVSEGIRTCEDHLISRSFVTGRNEVVAKVIFLHLFVILFTGGVSASVHARIPHPPGADTPRSRHPQSRHPPGADTPPPREQTPPPPRSRLRHTVNERPVRILLECILVLVSIFVSSIFVNSTTESGKFVMWRSLSGS